MENHALGTTEAVGADEVGVVDMERGRALCACMCGCVCIGFVVPVGRGGEGGVEVLFVDKGELGEGGWVEAGEEVVDEDGGGDGEEGGEGVREVCVWVRRGKRRRRRRRRSGCKTEGGGEGCGCVFLSLCLRKRRGRRSGREEERGSEGGGCVCAAAAADTTACRCG